MSDLDTLRALARQLPPPDFDDLVAVARKRRRRSVTALSAAAAVVILVGGLTGNALLSNDGAQELRPVDDPTPTDATPTDPTPTESSTGDEWWTLDRLREEGLRLLDDPAPAVPGPGVVVIDTSNGILAGSDSLYLVDDRAGTVQPLDAPKEVRYWGPNVDEFLWGVTDDCRVFWATDGAFEERQLDCSDGLDFTYGIYDDEFPLGWLQPGRMAVGEQSDGRQRNQNFVHASLDYGATWQRIPLEDGAAIADVLQPLG